MNWKLYVDSPEKRALDLCSSSLVEGDGRDYGDGCGWGYGDGYGWGNGNGRGDGYGYDGNGTSVSEWT